MNPATAGSDEARPLGPGTGVDLARNLLIERYSERMYQRYPDILAVISPEGIIQRLNPAFEEITGHSETLAVDLPLADWLHPEDRAGFAACQAQLQSELDRFNLVTRLRSRLQADSWCWISWSGFPGMETGSLFLVGRDVTEQKRAELRLQDRQKQLVQTIELAGLPTWELDLGSLELGMNDAMLALLGTSAAAEGGYRMPFAHFMDRYSDRANATNLVQRIVRMARSQQADFTSHFDYHLRTASGRSLTAQFHLRGILDDNQYMLRAFGTVSTVQTEQRASAATSVDTAPAPAQPVPVPAAWQALPKAVLLVNGDGELAEWNQAAAKVFGYPPETKPSHISHLLPEQYRDVLTKQLTDLRRNPSNRPFEGRWIELHGLRKSGQLFPIEVAIGGGLGTEPYTVLVRDRTDSELQRRMVQRLQAEVQALHERPRQVLESVPVALLLTDGHMVFDANPAAEVLWGEPLAQVQGRPLDALLHTDPPNAPWLDTLAEQVDRGDHRFRAQLLRPRRDALPVQVLATRYQPQDSRMLLLALLPDDGSSDTQALRADQARLAEALSVAKMATWQLDIATMALSLDAQLLAWLGLDEQRLPGRSLPWQEFVQEYVHPEDSPRVEAALREILDSLLTSQTAQASIRLISMGGRTRYMTLRMAGRRDNGRWTVVQGTSQDVTDVQQQEKERTERQTRLERQDVALLELTGSPLLSEDKPAAFLRVAQTMCEVLEVDRCSIWLHEGQPNAMTCHLLLERFKGVVEEEMVLSQASYPSYYSAIKESRVLPVKYVTIDPRTNQLASTYLNPNGIGSLMDTAILRGGQMVGIMCCEHRGFPRDWHPDEQRFAITMSELLALALESAERRQALDALAAKEVELSRANQELRLLNDALHQSVHERTLAFDQLKQAHQYLVQQEKLASLGQLLGGVAHEINTPVSIVLSNLGTLERNLSSTITTLPTLLHGLSEAQLMLFQRLVQRGESQAPIAVPAQEREQRAQVEAQLEQQGVPKSFELARLLVECGVGSELQPILPLLVLPQAETILEHAVALVRLRHGLRSIHKASEDTLRVVRALRSISHTPERPVKVPTALAEQLETVLTVFHNKLKHHIAVDTYYQPDVPPVPVQPEEMSQVWTQLIANAIEAMKGRGRLTVEQWQEAGQVFVRITDNGPGIPPDVLPRIFEPFFTTKPATQGTGLGLDIAKKIVEHHGGVIEVRSHPGQTSFTVRLPLVPPDVPASVS